MPAAVMGDMCVCVGPPDTVVLGSTGVFIGGKPAARMGDMCAHGGAITVGCPTVLIGEISGGGAGAASPGTPENVFIKAVVKKSIQNLPVENRVAIKQAYTMIEAAVSGKAFVHDSCNCPDCKKNA
jgi:hypothetical protein